MTPHASSRRAAADLVIAVVEDGRTLDSALAETESFDSLDGRDRAFARAIASATLRRLGGLDAVIATFLEKPLPETAHLARALLRTGAAQMLVLRTPSHAVVSETVSLANADRKAAGFAKLINAVLRRIGEQGAAILASLAPGADLPGWLFTRWRAVYGAEADAIARALLQEAPLDLSVKADAAGWAVRLGGEVLPTGGVRLAPGHPPLRELAGFEAGAWWVQDAAASLPARLFGDVGGRDVLDLCAAPGGKTLQLAAGGARVTALDKSAARLERLGRNLARAQLEAEIVCADALDWTVPRAFDCVLLDAPCSATGTMRRHPDVAWLRGPEDVRALAAQQARLLARAADFAKPGGRLVYAVCSLEPEEGQEIVSAAIKSGAWARAPISADEIGGLGQCLTADGDLRTLPSHLAEQGGMDGFYAARLVRG